MAKRPPTLALLLLLAAPRLLAGCATLPSRNPTAGGEHPGCLRLGIQRLPDEERRVPGVPLRVRLENRCPAPLYADLRRLRVLAQVGGVMTDLSPHDPGGEMREVLLDDCDPEERELHEQIEFVAPGSGALDREVVCVDARAVVLLSAGAPSPIRAAESLRCLGAPGAGESEEP